MPNYAQRSAARYEYILVLSAAVHYDWCCYCCGDIRITLLCAGCAGMVNDCALFPSFFFLVDMVTYHRHSSRSLVRTSWASQGADIAVAWQCPAQFTYLDVICLTRCLSCTNQQMQSLPLCFVLFCFFSERDDRYNDPKKYLSDINLSQKRTKGPGFPLACI